MMPHWSGGGPFIKVILLLIISSTKTSQSQSQHPPEITQGPLTQTVKAGGIVAFYCFATGDPSPNFTWKKNGKKLRYTDSRYLISDFEGGSLLRIEPVRRRREAGSYECEAENGVGDPVSVEATLEVFDDKELPKGFPQIIQNPGMKVVEKGRNAVLVCEASGDPRPTVTWVKDTMPINIQVNSRLTLLKQGKLRGKAVVKLVFEQEDISIPKLRILIVHTGGYR